MREKRWFPILYMFIVTAFFSAIIIGFTRATEARVAANQRFSYEQAVLKVLPDIYDEKAGQTELHRRYQEQLTHPSEETAGAYVLQQDGAVKAYALPFSGQGFWAPIRGVIGIDPEGETIIGLSFYEQSETPGLGARITEAEFREQFTSLGMRADNRPLVMKYPGEPLNNGQFHSITGATQTSTRLEKMMNDALANWRKEMQQKGEL